MLTTRCRIIMPDRYRSWWSYRQCRASAATTMAHMHCIWSPSRLVCFVWHASHVWGLLGNWSRVTTNFVVAILGFICYQLCISCNAPPCLMWIFLLNLSGNCPGGAKSRFTAPESWCITLNYYPPSSEYEFVVWGSWISATQYVHK